RILPACTVIPTLLDQGPGKCLPLAVSRERWLHPDFLNPCAPAPPTKTSRPFSTASYPLPSVRELQPISPSVRAASSSSPRRFTCQRTPGESSEAGRFSPSLPGGGRRLRPANLSPPHLDSTLQTPHPASRSENLIQSRLSWT